MWLCEWLAAHGWSPLFEVQGLVQDEVVRIFYSNVFNENHATLSFYTSVNKVPIHINPNYISHVTGIPREFNNPITFPPPLMTLSEKADVIVLLYRKSVA